MIDLDELVRRVTKELKPNEDADPYTDGSYSCHTCGWGGGPMLKLIVVLTLKESWKAKQEIEQEYKDILGGLKDA